MKVRVKRKQREAKDIISFELASLDGSNLPSFTAGSHIDVHVPGGAVRQYSLCGREETLHSYRIAVLREAASRGGSMAMHDQVAEGDVLEISAPRNHFPLVELRRTLLFAGGIGVTPLLCMAYRLSSLDADFEMHYCTRSTERTAFQDEILLSPFAHRVHFHFDEDGAAGRLELPPVLANAAAQAEIYVCGPAGFIEHVKSGARSAGIEDDRIHLEYFAAPSRNAATSGFFEVRIASTGDVYEVPPGRSVAQVLKDHGIAIETSCEQGICGACVTRVLEGKIDHRDHWFTQEEQARNDRFTPCCSRARSPYLVLDL